MKTDVTSWNRKLINLKLERGNILSGLIEKDAKQVKNKIDKYVTGPHYRPRKRGEKTGEKPIPRISYLLSKSIKMQKIHDYLYKIWSDGGIAPHNIAVHDGTKRTKPRRFIKDPVDESRSTIINKWKRVFNK